MFTGFPQETIQFFLDIRYHNNATYFNENRERYYRDVQAPFYAFIEAVMPTLLEADPRMETRPYKCLARLRRDTRFSRDKTPYRDHLWIWFHRAAEPRDGSLGFWFELGPQGVSWGLGSWDENRPMMERFRREMVAHPRQVAAVLRKCDLHSRSLVEGGHQWKRMEIPPQVPKSLADWYLRKDVFITQSRADMGEIGSPDLAERVAADFRAMTPIYQLLRGMGDAAEAEAAAAAQAEQQKPSDEW